jgi:indolepyruvate ferredoxin oxidoreductase, beta subunit
MGETKNIIMVGVGGQGIILASELLSEAALLAGYDVRKSEVHGMAQRGGSVSSHVRFGKKVLSPLIELGQADIMLAFEKVESLRASDYLKRGATIIMNNLEIVPTTVSLGVGSYPSDVPGHLSDLGFSVIMINAQEKAKEAGTSKAANVVLLASLASFLDIEKKIWMEVIRQRVPKKFLDINIAAFNLGYEV